MRDGRLFVFVPPPAPLLPPRARHPLACISNSALTPHQSHHTRHITHRNAQPFVSKRATGLVSGFVGAGGNMGGAITQAVFFTYAPYPADKAFIYMGIMSIVSRAWLM